MGFYSVMPDENKYIDNYFKWFVDFIVVVVIALFFLTYFCNQSKVVGNSMSKKLVNADSVLVDSIVYNVTDPKRYDVISFKKREKNGDEVEYIKRIIGMPGETIEIKEGKLYVNDKKLDYNEKSENIVNPGLASEKIKLSYDEYFVIGDNWNNSEDSRSNTVGNVKKSEIEGKVWLICWPFARIKIVN